ncbi:hypothetical protein RRF57_000269 [Xylaria bambusicola]|uniref:Uncharacterized protein n=1 Tax=Xylaria bambusicola TaxID=326684 RepID=A0AAN7U9W3_9PEZI
MAVIAVVDVYVHVDIDVAVNIGFELDGEVAAVVVGRVMVHLVHIGQLLQFLLWLLFGHFLEAGCDFRIIASRGNAMFSVD